MATEQFPLLFFKPATGVDPIRAAQAVLGGSAATPPPGVLPLHPGDVLSSVRKVRGFARLRIALPAFSLDNPRVGAAFEGTASTTHLHVRFFGDFERVAKPLFEALATLGLACYSVWDEAMLTEWPASDEPVIDRGFGARLTRILQRKTEELRATEPDERRRQQALDTFMQSPEFRVEMAREARREPKARGMKTFDDLVNCYVRWNDARATAAELGALRKLDAKFAAMSLGDLRAHIGDSTRLLLATAVAPGHANELRRRAENLGLTMEIEPI